MVEQLIVSDSDVLRHLLSIHLVHDKLDSQAAAPDLVTDLLFVDRSLPLGESAAVDAPPPICDQVRPVDRVSDA